MRAGIKGLVQKAERVTAEYQVHIYLVVLVLKRNKPHSLALKDLQGCKPHEHFVLPKGMLRGLGIQNSNVALISIITSDSGLCFSQSGQQIVRCGKALESLVPWNEMAECTQLWRAGLGIQSD